MSHRNLSWSCFLVCRGLSGARGRLRDNRPIKGASMGRWMHPSRGEGQGWNLIHGEPKELIPSAVVTQSSAAKLATVPRQKLLQTEGKEESKHLANKQGIGLDPRKTLSLLHFLSASCSIKAGDASQWTVDLSLLLMC